MIRNGLVLAVVMAGLAATASANLLTNPGFEDGDTGQIGVVPIPGWNSWGNSGWHHDDAGRVIDTKAVKFWWDDAGLWQDYAATSGAQYRYSVQAFNASSDLLHVWNGLLKAEFYDAGGGKLADAVVDRYYSATDPADQWVEVAGTVTAPAGAVTGRIVLLIAEWAPNPGGSLNYDNASVTLVPEPAALALVALGILAARRR
jgi:hypothetical protein